MNSDNRVDEFLPVTLLGNGPFIPYLEEFSGKLTLEWVRKFLPKPQLIQFDQTASALDEKG